MRVSAGEQRQTTQMELVWGHWIYFMSQTVQLFLLLFATTSQGPKQTSILLDFPLAESAMELM